MGKFLTFSDGRSWRRWNVKRLEREYRSCRQKEFPAFRRLMKSLAVWCESFGGDLESLVCTVPCVQMGMMQPGGHLGSEGKSDPPALQWLCV